ncbi:MULTISPECIES: type VI secretion protein [unclassified Streptomyces]|uniref:type VI secretion protein n=1 Tax=unclassified Streptomyces TaxID=2593676 RepID=UPI0022B5E8D4|nr:MULTISPECIES: type VI secretion protein [unclassified Streptomyces]MCZ7417497.1 type VI secretion protein [Streptomyces sp. WMMC897]MCZ7432674.1 type VI secretion protein [Streptomyces sp. WMMC1477]
MPGHGHPGTIPEPGRRPGGGIPDGLLVGLLALLLGLTVLAWTAVGLAGLLAHGAWPHGVGFTHTPLAVRALVADPADLAAAWPDADPATLSGPGLFWGLLIGEVMILFVVTVAVLTSLARRRARRRARDVARRIAEDTREEAPPGQPWEAREAARPHAVPDPRPPLRADSPHESARDPSAAKAFPPDPAPGSAPRSASASASASASGEPVPAPVPRSSLTSHSPSTVGLTGAARPSPGTAHGLVLRGAADPAEALAAADGPAVVVTADPDLWRVSVGARAKLGPTYVYDPAHRTDAPVRLRWAPERGCADPAVARSRAAALLAPVRSPATAEAAVHHAAETLLRCCLHAAAVSGKPFRFAHRWATGGSTADAVRILRRDTGAAPGSAGELEATLAAHPERREAAVALIAHALDALGHVHVRDACAGNRADSRAVESFAPEVGTLYIVGEAVEAPRRHAGVMPFVTALTSNVVEHGRRMAERSSSGRLDPPITLVLDDPAAVAPLADLPSLVNEATEVGIHAVAHLRSQDQARSWWPELVLGQLPRTGLVR